MKVLKLSSWAEAERAASQIRSALSVEAVEAEVKRIVEDVKERGDVALLEYARMFDGQEPSKHTLYAGRDVLEGALARVDGALADSLRSLAERVRAVEGPLAGLVGKRWRVEVGLGVAVETFFEPLRSVACYVPGGGAPYVSTAVMCGVAAREAGVKRLVAFAPPRALGDPMLAALAVAGFDGVYRFGGAHGVAALAYGTESVECVDKIAGPGGLYVTAAKRLVSKDVGVDMLAGPTELALFFSDRGGAEAAAWHLAAQAEHGDSTLLVAVTTDEGVAESLREALEAQGSPLFERVLRLLNVVVAEDLEVATRFLDALAPEHVEVFGCGGIERGLARALKNYGVLVVGCASSAVNDYYSGANHVLPTMGWARWRGGLSVLDFVALRRAVFFEGSQRELEAIARAVAPIALAEGFTAHLESIRRGCPA